MHIPKSVIQPAKDAYFPNLEEIPQTVIDGYERWAKEKGKDITEDNEENRKMMYKLACYCRAMWLF